MGHHFLSRIKAEEKRAQARKRNESRETVSVAGDADRVWDVSGAKENWQQPTLTHDHQRLPRYFSGRDAQLQTGNEMRCDAMWCDLNWWVVVDWDVVDEWLEMGELDEVKSEREKEPSAGDQLAVTRKVSQWWN